MYTLIQSYLTGRYQCTLESQIITYEYILSGVQILKVFFMTPSLDPCFFYNDLTITLNNNSLPILFADYTSVLITASNPIDWGGDPETFRTT